MFFDKFIRKQFWIFVNGYIFYRFLTKHNRPMIPPTEGGLVTEFVPLLDSYVK